MATIEGMGFTIDRITFVPSQFKNLVIDVTHDGVSVEPGTTLPKGSRLSLTVGQGMASESVIIPDLQGLPLDSAILAAHADNVNIGDIEYDIQPANDREAAEYRVVAQNPEAGAERLIGERIRLTMSRSYDERPAAE